MPSTWLSSARSASCSDGRICFERKVAEGKAKKEAMRSLECHITNAVHRQLVFGPDKGVREDTQGRLHGCVTVS
jgi:hypothetical protein